MANSDILLARDPSALRRVVLPTELLTAAEVAKEFLAKAGFPFAQLEEGKYDMTKDQWRLIFNIGLLVDRKKTVTIDNKTAQVIAVE